MFTQLPQKISSTESAELPPKPVEPINLNKPILVGSLVHTIFGYCDIEIASLRVKSSMLTIDEIYMQLLLDKLLSHVVRGQHTQAEVMIQENPKLLLMSGEIKDYSGRLLKGTAFQMALGAEDVFMCKMIALHLDELEKINQYKKQFPGEYKDNTVYIKEVLGKVVNAIAGIKEEIDCKDQLEAFRGYLKPNNVITMGKHFDVQWLIMAYALYEENYDRFGGDSSLKNNLYWRKVIGYLQRFLPVSYARAYCQKVLVDMGPSDHSLYINKSSGSPYYPLDTNVQSRLGYEFAVAGGVVSQEAKRWGSVSAQCQLKVLSTAKARELQGFLPPAPARKFSSIM